MAIWLKKISKRIEIEKKRSEKKRLLGLNDVNIRKKNLDLPPSNFLSRLYACFRHPLTFCRGGVEAVMQSKHPAVADPLYSQLLNQPLYQYLWDYYHKKELLHSIHWMGIPTLKIVSDLWVYHEILFQKKPDIVIEIGSHYGGSTLFLAQMLDLIGHGQVISIEIHNQNFLGQHPRVLEIPGDCSSPEILEKVQQLIRGKSVMVIHDGDHREFAALRDLELYGPMVSRGHYFIMEDGVYDLFNSERGYIHPDQKGPLAAIRTFLKLHPQAFTIDTHSERFLLTSNPYGYLLKTGEL